MPMLVPQNQASDGPEAHGETDPRRRSWHRPSYSWGCGAPIAPLQDAGHVQDGADKGEICALVSG